MKRKTFMETEPNHLGFTDFFKNPKEFTLRKMRLHYFFTESNADLTNFFNNTEIEIRITDGPNYSKVLSQAT